MNEPFAPPSCSKLLVALAAVLTLGACGSSSDKGGGAGSGGGASGNVGGAGGGDAAAGSGGSDGGGTTDAPAEMAAAPQLNACGHPANLGAVSPMNQTATEGGDRSVMTLHDSVSWLGQVNAATRPDTLDVQLYKSTAPFGAMLSSMSISLTGQNDFSTCGACVLFHPMFNDGVEIRAQTNYIATSGTLNVTAVPNGTTMRLTATLSNVTFEHVMIDPSFKTTKIDDCAVTLTSASIDSDVKLIPGP
jgi:hypothetical protein